MKVLQEKFEVHEPIPSRGHTWASDKSARTKKGLQTRHAGSGQYQRYGEGLNELPPGMDLDDQGVREVNPMRTITAGTDDVTDNPRGNDFIKGYVKLPLLPTDDMYTREHQDAFYDEITVDGETGYLERNNTLDRS